MFDLKVINSVLDQLEEERGIPRAKVLEAIETSLATAYKKEYGKRGQIVRASFDLNTGTVEFNQVKIVVDKDSVKMPEDEPKEGDEETQGEKEQDTRVRFNAEQHMLLDDARLMKKGVEVDEEMVFPLESKGDFGRIAAQTAKQVIIQKIREAEKTSILGEYETREGEVIAGTVQRIERGNVFLDLGRATAILPYDEQIHGERFRQGERIRGYLYSVEEGARGVFLRVSRSHPKFLQRLFEYETPELTNGAVVIKAIAREPGSRSKIAVHAVDEHIDPVGALVGQRGVRVSTVMSELGGEKIDVIEWSEDPIQFIEDALSPAKVLAVELQEEQHIARVEVSEDQQSLAIGKGGQNVRLAAKLTSWKIDIHSAQSEKELIADEETVVADDPRDDVAEAAQADAAQTDELADIAAEATETDAETDEALKEALAKDEAITDESESPVESETAHDNTEEDKKA